MSGTQLVYESGQGEFTIARMTEHDLLEVVELEESCGLSLWGWEAYRLELDRPESVMLVALEDSRDACQGRCVCGFIAARMTGPELHINNIGVSKHARRRGIGAKLLQAALEFGLGRGARTSVLEVRAGNEAAQALYRRFGYSVTGRRRNYYRDPPEDALVMLRQFETELD